MNLRRGLLLFAIVMVSAALAASLSQQRSPSPPAPRVPPAAAQLPEQRRLELRLDSTGRRDRRRIPVGRAATVVVEVERPATVQIPDLGLLTPADARTPARFDVLFDKPGEHRVIVTPNGADPVRADRLVAR